MNAAGLGTGPVSREQNGRPGPFGAQFTRLLCPSGPTGFPNRLQREPCAKWAQLRDEDDKR